MTRERYFEKMRVRKGFHYCMFCDQNADFIVESTVSDNHNYPMCNQCAELFKRKIDIGMNLSS